MTSRRVDGQASGDPDPIRAPEGPFTVLVRHHPTKQEFALGAAGVAVWCPVFSFGPECGRIEEHPDDYVMVIRVDVPAHLGLPDAEYDVMVGEIKYVVKHYTFQRGQEEYSTLDTTALPLFSSIEIIGPPVVDAPPRAPTPAEVKRVVLPTSRVLWEVLERIVRYVEIRRGTSPIRSARELSYTVDYHRPGGAVSGPVCRTLHPFPGRTAALSPVAMPPIEVEDVSEFIRVATTIERELGRSATLSRQAPFSDQVLRLVHDFCFYARQHPGVMQKLEEEQIRDLLVVAGKVRLGGSGDGEVFHHRGKLDYKFINPTNQYELHTGELKWWDGVKSFEFALEQATEIHATGQEHSIGVILLSRNKDTASVYAQALDRLRADPRCVSGGVDESMRPSGSREMIGSHSLRLLGADVPVYVCILRACM